MVWLPRGPALWLFGGLCILALLLEKGRRGSGLLSQLCQRWFGRMLRTHESAGARQSLTGATFMLIGAFLCLLFFSQWIAAVSMAVMLVADTAASLIGRRFGRISFGGKTLEGCLAYLVSGVAVVAIIGLLADRPLWFLCAGVVGVVLSLPAELYARRLRLDDNLLIPLVIGGVMTVLGGML